jgi:hypothetical protein
MKMENSLQNEYPLIISFSDGNKQTRELQRTVFIGCRETKIIQDGS